MSASPSPTDSVVSLSQHQSDKSITAETVSDTVMAEQISQNVVDNSESTSAQPLVDVSATQTTFDSADTGTLEQPLPDTKTAALQASQLANDYATDANALTSSVAPGADTTDLAADPSAGHAASEVVQVPAAILAASLADKIGSDTQLPNGTHSTAIAGDINPEDAQSVDVSLNSDTEGSRGDASELKKDDKHHTRTNSVKKPTTFSKVSVTKNFLAKSATAAPVVAKPGEKPSPVGTPPQSLAAKPRLIAKTGTSMRDIQKTRLGSDGAGGPDASKVWNKNRPVAPPPPKTFTDEELKQHYGIHMASRLQTDENGKESKWADIDDDEDDWAPETVVWMDGTKSTLTPQDAPPIPKEQKPASPAPPPPSDGVKPVLAIKKPTELGPTKTILKPGAIVAAAQARQSGSPSGIATDKSLKAKSPAPTPAKSPWAALPPVDKISPINPPVQQQTQPLPFATQDARAYEQPLPPQPAREIAADTFDRSWREGEGVPRELFNSANGRYEPVTEGRRGSIKPDSSARKPAVLQRPSQGAAAPAEPSAAFQTRSTTQTDGPWARRRGSSVSQGSLPPARRMSITKGHEMSPVSDRRPSLVVGHDMRSSPTMPRAEPAQPMFSQQSAWQQQMPARPDPASEENDLIKAQDRIMREKRELAKKRRQEEEERLEREKQERLKARLAELEGAGKSRKEREAEAAAAAVSKTSDSPAPAKQNDSPAPTTAAPETQVQPAKPAEMAAMVAPALEAQSLPPAPEEPRAQQPSPGEIMPSPLPPKPPVQQQQPAGLPERTNGAADQAQYQQTRPHLSPRANARVPFQQSSAAYRAPASSYSSPGDRKPQPFGRAPLPNTDTFSTPWPTTAPNGNVWGTSGIGNGTFESANVFAPMPMSQQNSSLPPPPGMTRPTSARISPQSLAQESRSPNLQQQAIGETHRGFAPPGFEARSDPFANQGRNNNVPSPAAAPGLGRPTHAPGPIAPPSRSQPPQPAQMNDRAAAWRAASHNLPNQYRADAEAAEKKRSEATPSAPRDETIKETFKMTAATGGRLGAPRKFENIEYTVHDAQGSRSVPSLSPVPPNAQTQPSGPFSTASPELQDTWKQPGENTVRIPDGSLNPAHGGMAGPQAPNAPPHAQQTSVPSNTGQLHYPAAPLATTVSSKDQSPPPPETSSHPVNSGDSSHPLVKLPPGKPVVKLPPAPAQAQQFMPPQNTMMMLPRPISNLGAPARPIVSSQAWQARFNGLFNRTPIQTETPPSPPKTPPKMQGPALAVTSSTRGVMDDAHAVSGATVSLPRSQRAPARSIFTIDDSDDVVSKPTIEQMFTEELSFGSKPKISVPKDAAYERDVYEDMPIAMMRPNPMAFAVGEGQTKGTFHMIEVHPKRHEGVFVSLPHTKLIRRLVRGQPSGRGPRPGGVPQERKTSMRFTKGKGREATNTSPVTSGTPSTSSRKTSAQNGAPTPTTSTTAGSTPTVEGGKRSAPRRGGPRKSLPVKSA